MISQKLFGKFRRGSISQLFAILLPIFIGFTAMAIDWGMVSVSREQAQTAADVAALAAAANFFDQQKAENSAKAYAQKVSVNNIATSVQSIEWGIWDGSLFIPTTHQLSEVVVVKTQATINMPFANILGMNNVIISSSAGAAPNAKPVRAPDTVLILDLSCSMSSAEIVTLKAAANDLVDCISQNSTQDSRMAIGAFTAHDKVIANWHTTDPIGISRIKNAINSITICGTGTNYIMPCNGTNQAAGMALGLELLRLTEASRIEVERLNKTDIGASMIVFSDGEPNVDEFLVSNRTGFCEASYWSPASNPSLLAYSNVLPSIPLNSISTLPWRNEPMTNTGLAGIESFCRFDTFYGSSPKKLIKALRRCSIRNSDGTCRTWTSPTSYSIPSDTTTHNSWVDYYRQYAIDNKYDIHTVYYETGGSVSGTGSTWLNTRVRTPDGIHMFADTSGEISDSFEIICRRSLAGTPGLLF